MEVKTRKLMFQFVGDYMIFSWVGTLGRKVLRDGPRQQEGRRCHWHRRLKPIWGLSLLCLQWSLSSITAKKKISKETAILCCFDSHFFGSSVFKVFIIGNLRFLSELGRYKSKDSGGQRDASALRDEVCLVFSFFLANYNVMDYDEWFFFFFL